MEKIISFHIHNDDCYIVLVLILNCFQQEHDIAGLSCQAGNTRYIYMSAFGTNQEISVIFNRDGNIIAGFHQAGRDRCFFINVIQS